MATFDGVEIFTDADIEDEVGCESEVEVEEYFEEFFLETVNEVDPVSVLHICENCQFDQLWQTISS